MKTKIHILAIIAVVIALIYPASGYAKNYTIKVNPYTLENDKGKSSVAKGSFSLSEGDRAQASFYYSWEGKNVGITTSTGYTKSASMLLRETDPRFNLDEIALLVDMYFQLSHSSNGQPTIELVIEKSEQNENDKGNFRFTSETSTFAIPPDGLKTLLLKDDLKGRKLMVDISISGQPEGRFKQLETPKVTFDINYSLKNLDKDRIELGDKSYSLKSNSNPTEANSNYSFQKIFELDNGDTLLYRFACQINNLRMRAPDQLEFTVAIDRAYSIKSKSEKSTNIVADAEVYVKSSDNRSSAFNAVIGLKKDLEATTKDTIEMKIPKDLNSSLPFNYEETLRIIPKLSQ